jgi:hypothetical protein
MPLRSPVDNRQDKFDRQNPLPIRRIFADYDQPNFEDTKGLYIFTTVRIILYHPLFRTEDAKDEGSHTDSWTQRDFTKRSEAF